MDKLGNNKGFKNKGLVFKLSVYILTGVSFIFFLTLLYTYQVARKLLLNEAQQVAFLHTNAAADKLEMDLLSIQKIPSSLIYLLENLHISETELRETLYMVVNNNRELSGSCIAFEPFAFNDAIDQYAPFYYKTSEGVKYKDLGQGDYHYLNQNWYSVPKNTGASTWSEPYFDEGGSDILIATYSVPFYSINEGKRKFRGILTADLALNWLESHLDSIKIYKTGYAFLVSQKGRIITYPNNQITMKETMFSLADKYNRPDLATIGHEMMQGKTNFLPYKSLYDGRPCMIYYEPLQYSNWSIGVVFPEKELFADLDKLFWRILLISILGIAGLFIVIVLVSKSIIKPLYRLSVTAEKIGTGNFDGEISFKDTTREISILGNSMKRMQKELKEYVKNLKITTAANEKIESELNIAHEIQLGMLPKIFPPFPNREDIDIYAVLEPARQVGGDFYDFFFLKNDLLCFSVGDVSDKGVPASLMMAITITMLRAKAKTLVKPSDIMFSMNQDLSNDNESMMFVTMFLGILNLKTGELSFCNAGHNYPYIIKQNGKLVSLEETHGTPLGIYYDQKYQSGICYLEKYDKIIVYTDGVSEAMNKFGEPFSDDCLENIIGTQCVNKTPADCIAHIMDEVAVFTKGVEQSDDITLMALHVK